MAMGLSNAERQERWRVKRAAEVEALRKAAAQPASGREIEALRKELAAAKVRIREMGLEMAAQAQGLRDVVKRRAANAKPKASLPRATQIAVDKVLHPDRGDHATEAEKDNASKLWNAWKDTRKRARS
jgi:hypothetical protein